MRLAALHQDVNPNEDESEFLSYFLNVGEGQLQVEEMCRK